MCSPYSDNRSRCLHTPPPLSTFSNCQLINHSPPSTLPSSIVGRCSIIIIVREYISDYPIPFLSYFPLFSLSVQRAADLAHIKWRDHELWWHAYIHSTFVSNNFTKMYLLLTWFLGCFSAILSRSILCSGSTPHGRSNDSLQLGWVGWDDRCNEELWPDHVRSLVAVVLSYAAARRPMSVRM